MIKVYRLTGDTSGSDPVEATTYTDITDSNTRLNATDAHSTSGTTHPILIPDSGTNYSYKCSTQLGWDGTAGTGTINNIKWYTDGSNGLGDGVGMNVKSTTNDYSQAAGTEGETGDEMTDGSDAFGYTSASPLSVSGSATDPEDGEKIGDIVEQQVTVDSTAGAGATSSETVTFQYDSTVA